MSTIASPVASSNQATFSVCLWFAGVSDQVTAELHHCHHLLRQGANRDVDAGAHIQKSQGLASIVFGGTIRQGTPIF